MTRGHPQVGTISPKKWSIPGRCPCVDMIEMDLSCVWGQKLIYVYKAVSLHSRVVSLHLRFEGGSCAGSNPIHAECKDWSFLIAPSCAEVFSVGLSPEYFRISAFFGTELLKCLLYSGLSDHWLIILMAKPHPCRCLWHMKLVKLLMALEVVLPFWDAWELPVIRKEMLFRPHPNPIEKLWTLRWNLLWSSEMTILSILLIMQIRVPSRHLDVVPIMTIESGLFWQGNRLTGESTLYVGW